MPNNGEKTGRNDPCPCGSEKKYKNCCGKGEVDIELMLKCLFCIVKGLQTQRVISVVKTEVLEKLPENWAELLEIRRITTPDLKPAYFIGVKKDENESKIVIPHKIPRR